MHAAFFEPRHREKIMVFGQMAAGWFASACEVSGKHILEVGADPNLYFVNELSKLGAAKVVASNVTDEWSRGKPPENVTVEVANGETVHSHFGRNSFDAVVGCNILEHISNLRRVFTSIHAALKPGGDCWLHGDPLWTSSVGHHIMLPGRNFHDEKPIIPPWAHLYMSRDELRDWLSSNNTTYADAREIRGWVYTSFDVSRNSRQRILEEALSSRFEIISVGDGPGDAPDNEVLERIKKANIWWNPLERYDLRGMILHMRKV